MVDREAAKGADLIKLWVDDEFGMLEERMPPPISSAVIDQAHKDGKLAVAHIFYYSNAAELTREGVAHSPHSVRDRAVDDALLGQMTARSVRSVEGPVWRERVSTSSTRWSAYFSRTNVSKVYYETTI